MAKVFYVISYADEAQIDFFKTEKEAIKYGKSEFEEFEFNNNTMEDEDGYKYIGGQLTFKKGILFSFEGEEVKVQAMEDAAARKYALNLGDEGGSAIFFNGFSKGMYGTLGSMPSGDFAWEFTGDDIYTNESKSSLKHIPTFEQFNSLDFLEMQASSQGMTREEWIAHYGTSTAGVDEKNEDGTISPDEDERREGLLADVRFMTNELIDHIAKEAEEIGGYFRAPGIEADCKKLIKEIMKKRKFKF